MSLLTKKFWVDAGERATKTFAQVLVGVFSADVTVANVGWHGALVAAGTAAVVSLLTSVASARVGSPNSASLVD